MLDAFLNLIQTESLPRLGPEVRSDSRRVNEVRDDVSRFCQENAIAGLQGKLLHSAALLWHDALDASHEISQDIKTSDGSFLHGIMHRREPDSSNAKYWFRLVGAHPCFSELNESVAAYGRKAELENLTSPLTQSGDWEPFLFVDACSRAMQGSHSSAEYRALQEIQAIEFRTLLAHIFSTAGH